VQFKEGLFLLASIIFVAEAIGTIAFAISGAMLAAEKNLDIFGILVLGIVTAFGGGVIRDLLLGITPPAMFSNHIFFLLAALASCAVFLAYFLMDNHSLDKKLPRWKYCVCIRDMKSVS